MKSLSKIFFILFIFYSSATKAQIGLEVNQLTVLSLPSPDFNYSFPRYSPTAFKIGAGSSFHLQGTASQNNCSMPFPTTYAYNELAFFCRVEVELEKKVKFPVKFRLGDVNYVDQLEGKDK